MGDRIVAEIFPPGEFIREELEARNWSQLDLAEIMGRPPRVVNELIAAKRSITPDTARDSARRSVPELSIGSTSRPHISFGNRSGQTTRSRAALGFTAKYP